MTTIDLDAIRQREQAADSGPWRVVEEHGHLTIQTDVRYGESREVAEMTDPDDYWSSKLAEENAEFIAHARQDIPALLAEVERLTAELATKTEVAQTNKRHVAYLTEVIEAVDALHKPRTNSVGHEWCKACGMFWPCTTNRALEKPADITRGHTEAVTR